MFFVKRSKNAFWITNTNKKNTEILISSLLFFIVYYFLNPNLLINLSILISLCLM
jgi:hypothetical protein